MTRSKATDPLGTVEKCGGEGLKLFLHLSSQEI